MSGLHFGDLFTEPDQSFVGVTTTTTSPPLLLPLESYEFLQTPKPSVRDDFDWFPPTPVAFKPSPVVFCKEPVVQSKEEEVTVVVAAVPDQPTTKSVPVKPSAKPAKIKSVPVKPSAKPAKIKSVPVKPPLKKAKSNKSIVKTLNPPLKKATTTAVERAKTLNPPVKKASTTTAVELAPVVKKKFVLEKPVKKFSLCSDEENKLIKSWLKKFKIPKKQKPVVSSSSSSFGKDDVVILHPDPEDYRYIFKMDDEAYIKFLKYYKRNILNNR